MKNWHIPLTRKHSHLSIERDIPIELEKDYNKIIQSLTKHGNIQNEVENLSELEAEHFAQQIVCLFEKTAHLVH